MFAGSNARSIPFCDVGGGRCDLSAEINVDAENEAEAPLCLDAPPPELNYKVLFWPRFRSRY